MNKKVGIGVIGTGFARRTQIPAFNAIEQAEIVSVTSGRMENAESTAQEFGIPHFSSDWTETVEHPDVDLVCITTPPDLHLAMTLASIKNGKHVLCEKPMAMNTAQAVEMEDAALNSGLMALIDHELRFTNGRLEGFRMIREGAIGKIRHIKYLFRNSARGDSSLPWTWWSDVEKGGGTLGAIVSHVIDSIHWFTGVGVSSVDCRLRTHITERPFEGALRRVTTDDEAILILDLEEGELTENPSASISASMVEAGPYRNRIELYGTKGAIRIEDGGEVYRADMGNNDWTQHHLDLGKTAPGMQPGGWSKGFTKLSELIVEALLAGRNQVKHAANFEDGVRIQRVLDAARESNKNSRIVRVS
ncbi:MAG: Gfo/Idh/MocA family oxidoreductase [Pyrinomonadaceae bacterium]|nr:Gfo/Idh/MocA family oxidoreductase [Pyrinomonadaceae bacterium]